MRNILFLSFILLMICFVDGVAERKTTVANRNDGEGRETIKDEIRNHIRNDSVFKEAISHGHIFYFTGEGGHIWSMIVDTDPDFTVFYGSTRTGELNSINLRKDNALIIWGLDSLPKECSQMNPVYRDTPGLTYTQIMVDTDNGIFKLNDAIKFIGPDSVAFNNKLNRLHYFMLWLALPELQGELPKPK